MEAFTLHIASASPEAEIDSLLAMAEAIEVDLCYCSVYGECWTYVKDEWARPTATCAGVPRLPR